MSLTSSDMSVADIAAVMGTRNNDGFGGFGGDGWWILLLFILLGNGAWGNGFGFGGNAGSGAVPYMVNNDVQRGFDQSAIMAGINGINTTVANGFANAEVSRCNAQANLLSTLNSNQNATTAGMNAIASSLQSCCCENRAGLADLKYTVATEACADRSAISDALKDVIASNTANTQAILDKMCQQEIDALKTQNANLQTQLNIASLGASQNAQTAAILADNAAQTQALEQYLNPAPIPAYVVPSPNGCYQNYNGCGCAVA